MPKINLGQVFTPKIIADFMVELFDGDKTSRTLEPCFGTGVFVDSMLDHGFTNVFANELDKNLFKKYAIKKGVSYSNSDFLTFDERTKYRMIIMNPPYVRQEEINNLSKFGINKTQLRKEDKYKNLPSKANLYCYFILKALSLLDEDGELIAIFPSTWTTKDSFLSYALESAGFRINKQFNCVGLPFGSDVLVDVDIVVISKGTTETPKKKIIYKDGKLIEEKGIEQSLSINECHCKLSSLAKVKRGFSSGYNDFFFKDIEGHDFDTVPCLSNPRLCTSFVTTDRCFNRCLIVNKKRISEELEKYIRSHESEVLKTQAPTVVYRAVCKGEQWFLFNPSKSKEGTIVFSYIVRDKMRFILLHKNALVRDNFYTISSTLDSFLLLALLNNYYSYSRLELAGKKYGAGLLKLQKYDVNDLFIINPYKLEQDDINRLINASKEIICRSTDADAYYDLVSSILEKYETMSLGDIKKTYSLLKKERLEAYEQ